MQWTFLFLYLTPVIYAGARIPEPIYPVAEAAPFDLEVNDQIHQFEYKAVINPRFSIYWNLFDNTEQESGRIKFGLSTLVSGHGDWVAMGFSEQGTMVPSTAVISSIPKDLRVPQVKEYHIAGYSLKGVQPAHEQMEILKVKQAEVEYPVFTTEEINEAKEAKRFPKKLMKMVFSVNITHEPAINLEADAKSGIILARGVIPESVTKLSFHQETHSFHLVLNSVAKSASAGTDKSGTGTGTGGGGGRLDWHVQIMLVAWLIISPIAILAGSYPARRWLFPRDTALPPHTSVHRLLMFITSTGVLSAVWIGYSSTQGALRSLHGKLGILVGGLVVGQLIGGMLRVGSAISGIQWLKEKKGFLSKAHGTSGKVLHLLALLNCMYGLEMFVGEWWWWNPEWIKNGLIISALTVWLGPKLLSRISVSEEKEKAE